jgi:hypothetical protein
MQAVPGEASIMREQRPIPEGIIDPGFIAGAVESLVAECQGIAENRLRQELASISAAVLAEQLWRGSLASGDIQQALLTMERVRAFLTELATELSSLTAGIFQQPVLLRLTLDKEDFQPCPAIERRILGEQLSWCRETYAANKILQEVCHQVWQQAINKCAWPVRRLKPGRLLWGLAGVTPGEEERRCLQELTRSVEGIMVNMQKRLSRAISLQVAGQIWSLYDDLATESAATGYIDPDTYSA